MFTIPSNLKLAIIKTAIEEALRIRLENIAALEKQPQTRKDKKRKNTIRRWRIMHQNQRKQNNIFVSTKEIATWNLFLTLIAFWQHCLQDKNESI